MKILTASVHGRLRIVIGYTHLYGRGIDGRGRVPACRRVDRGVVGRRVRMGPVLWRPPPIGQGRLRGRRAAGRSAVLGVGDGAAPAEWLEPAGDPQRGATFESRPLSRLGPVAPSRRSRLHVPGSTRP